jgi:hypothetical protein
MDSEAESFSVFDRSGGVAGNGSVGANSRRGEFAEERFRRMKRL